MKKVLIVYDAPGWAFHRWAEGIQKYASKRKYDVHIMMPKQYHDIRATDSLRREVLATFDGVCNLSWAEAPFPQCIRRHTTVIAHHGCEFTTGSDWLVWGRVAATHIRNRKTAKTVIPRFDAAFCINEFLYNFARREQLNDNLERLIAGVDDEVFKPGREAKSSKLVVGWCGQSPEGTRTTKGYHEILEPLMKITSDFIEWRVLRQSHTDSIKTREQMVKWYQSLDAYAMTSISDGGPNTIYEAAACGLPVIGTHVGEMPMLATAGCISIAPFTDQGSADFTIEEFFRELKALHADRERARYIGREARALVERRLSWKVQADRWCESIAGADR